MDPSKGRANNQNHAILERVHDEVRDCLDQIDRWLLVHIKTKPGQHYSLGADSVFHGFQDHRELRGPRWRELRSALEFRDSGFSWVVAGPVGFTVLARRLLNDEDIPGVIMHESAVSRWAPECGRVHGAVNSVHGFVNASSKEAAGLAARRPGRAVRKRLSTECCFCGSTESLTLHHVIPRSMGGATEEENLRPVCRPCHELINAGKLDDSHLRLEMFFQRIQNLTPDSESA